MFTRVVASAAAVAFLATPGTAAAVVPDDDPGQGTARTFRSGDPAASHGDLRPTTGALPGAVRRPEDKITTAARKNFTARGNTSFWLRFGEAPDLSAAYEISDWAERGRYVTETLQAAARESQAAAVADLERAGVSYETYWASNAILVENGSLDLATELAANAEVTQVRPTVRYALPEPAEVTAEEQAVVAAAPTSGIAAINADDVWALGATGGGIVVSNIDTGVSRANPSVAAAYRGASSGHDYNWYDAAGTGDGAPSDDNGHGTHTVGTMIGGVGTSASSGNEYAFGVAPDAEWIAANGCADLCLDTALVRSGQWILAPTRWDGSGADPAKRPHVVNNSWGEALSTDPFMADVVAAWEAAGIFAAFANGNEGEHGCESSGAPGSQAASYSVGALRASGTVADFSSRGPGQSGSVKPDITAPGVGVLSAVPGSTQLEQLSGTSMAAPHVAGAVALLWSAFPALVGDVPATRAILDGSAVDVGGTAALACGGTADDNNVYGEGRLDVLAAYELAQSMEFDATQDPSVTGTAKVGETLTAVADGAAWSPAASLDYQWRRDGTMISGATNTTYQVQPADAGAEITVTVLGTAEGRLPTARTSAPTAPVANATMSGGGWISGTVRVGNTLRAKAGTAWPSGTQFTYQWKADGTAISGATGFTYKPTASKRGANLTVTLTAKRKGYDTVTKTVGGKTVASGVFSTSTPRIQGTPAVGMTVKAIAAQWTPGRTRTTYQWKVNGTKIKGATSASYKVPAKYKGKTLTVTVKGYRTGYKSSWRTSKGLKVGKAFSTTSRPGMSGRLEVGGKLTAKPGTWKPSPSGLSYQWYADGRPIPDATGKTLRIKGPQYKKRITVQVTARRSGYATTPRLSGRTPEVAASSITIPEGGWTGVSAGTYTAKAGSSTCVWERWASETNRLGADYGSGWRVATVKSTDWAFWSEGCGTWTKYYPGMTKARYTTWKDGVFVLGDQLERGTYVTSGPGSEGVCHYAILSETTGSRSGAHVIASGRAAEPMTLTIPSGARAFETAGCSWRRVS
ncbi:S8 family serine peptidase [Myceligenerans pegani]|uniref:S8 family serine peptidase n=1 Tax=Myceligenerans pegani TaxID=2776917 RepID=A0ABR9MY80_9MICO|nr:S8 family serine peptidase [Myceligenerans sp. TRM 65318]MBE1875889.1 S8 family serine peptidase [Myceligenerans sp. TRM 65318]MBE3018160.1 S8 family serine peptidase [Myceligenerans sp. TRM 65318]